ncbi:MAG: hypothetical protein ABEI98_11305 [Halorhabdus sp.]
MGEKTDELRDLFLDVAGTETVTEDQETSRGTLSTPDDETVDRQLRSIVERMDDRFDFETDLTDDQRVALVRAFYRGESDAELADRLDCEVAQARQARLELHLFRESDTDAPIDWERLQKRLTEGDDATLAADLGVDPATVARYRRVLAARREARAVSHRFRSSFRDVLPDADLADRLTDDVTEDGLVEAAADIETDVSF